MIPNGERPGLILIRRRNALGITQAQLANVSGVCARTIRRIETKRSYNFTINLYLILDKALKELEQGQM